VHDPEADVAELLDEVFADLDSGAGLPLAELEPAQIEAWVSNLLAAWRTDLAVPDPTAADRQLVARCVAAETTEALLICRSVAVLAPASATEAAAAAAALVAAGVAEPEVGPATGNEQVTAAWVVEPVDEPRIGQEVAVVVGFIHPDSSEHVLLADLAIDTEAPDGAERLVGLRLDGPADGVIGVAADDEWNGVVGAGLDDGDDEEFNIPLTASTVEPALALHRVAAAWEASINDRPAIAATALDLLLVNQLVAAARLRTGLGADAPSFLDSVDQRPLLGAEVAALPADDVPADPETAAANAASLPRPHYERFEPRFVPMFPKKFPLRCLKPSRRPSPARLSASPVRKPMPSDFSNGLIGSVC